LLNDLSSATHDQLFKTLSAQVSAIAAGIKELPAIIIASLADAKPVLSTPSDPLAPTSGPVIELLPELDPALYPDVNHWTNVWYNQLKKGKGKLEGDEDDVDINDLEPGTSKKEPRSKGKVSVILSYMEKEDGTQQDEVTKDAARATARGFWLRLLKAGKAPLTFGRLEVGIKHEYIMLMEKTYPWLRLCANHWKAEQIGHNHYSQWYPGAAKNEAERVAKEAAAKAAAEGRIIDVDADSNDNQDSQGKLPKRPRPDDETRESKRRRVEKVQEPEPPSKRTPVMATVRPFKVCSFTSSNHLLY